MPFPRLTRSQLLALARTEIETRLPGSDARLRRSFLDAIARIAAELAHALLSYLDFGARQAFPTTAEAEFLVQWGAIYGVNELPAQFCQGLVTFTGSELALVPAETLVRRADGREYTTLEEVSISGGSATVSVLSVETGLDGNTDIGVTLTLLSPIPGIQSSALVADDGDGNGILGGTDVESTDSLRARIVARIQRPPGGGTIADYIARTKEYAGVTDVHVFAPLVEEDTQASIGSAAEGSDVSGVWSARGQSRTAKLLIAFQTAADIANSETVTLTNARVQDATDAAGAGAANFGSLIGPVVLATAPGAGGPHTLVGEYEIEVDVQTARAFMRAHQVRLTTSAAGTFVAWTASLQYKGGPGDVGVAPLFYDREDPLPLGADLIAIQALLDAPEFKTLGATSIAYGLVANPKAFTIALGAYDTATLRAAITAALVDLYRRKAVPGGKVLISQIREAISQAAGETDHVLTTPTADHDLAGDRTKIHTVGVITWT